MFQRFSIYALLVGLLVLAGCSSNQTRITTEADSYERASELLESERYVMAIEQLEAMENRFPFGVYASQVQLDLIYATYSDRQYDASLRRANRFIRLQPAHPEIDYVYYLRGLTSFGMAEQSAGLLSTRNPVDRDISGYERTFAQMREFITLYPNSDYVDPAKGIMQVSRTRLAEYNLNVATYYYQVKKPDASLARLNRLFEDFAGEDVQADGLALAARAYEMQGDDARAAQMVNILRTEHPDSELLSGGDTLVADFRFRRPWYFWLTLGVVG
ncbi:MAG: outer membrane protein assembly factor BamD [Natronospirillum sp.]